MPVDPTPDASPVHARTRRIRRGAAIAGAAVAVALAAAGCSSTPAPSAAPPAPQHGKHAKHADKGVSGTVQAENGSTWTVTTTAGKQVTVALAPTTVFGTKAAPSSADRFPVGAPVRVSGTVSGTTVAAKRISAPKNAAPAPAPGPA